MSTDVRRLIDFYRSPLGKIARALVREEVIKPLDKQGRIYRVNQPECLTAG